MKRYGPVLNGIQKGNYVNGADLGVSGGNLPVWVSHAMDVQILTGGLNEA